jgi:hypothetical protein
VDITRSHSRAIAILSPVALVMAALRYFMEGRVAPLGVLVRVGWFFPSITLGLVVGLIVIVVREGLAVTGGYWRAAARYLPFTAWC